MVLAEQKNGHLARLPSFQDNFQRTWKDKLAAFADEAGQIWQVECDSPQLVDFCRWLTQELNFAFATLIVEQIADAGWSLLYLFHRDDKSPWVRVHIQLDPDMGVVPSLVGLPHGPSFDWHEREAEDLFGIHFQGHPRLGEFILHEDWPEGVNPMRRDFDARLRFESKAPEPKWVPPTVVTAPGSFSMPIGPVFSDFAESAHFLLETVGEDVIRTIPRFFYKYRGLEKIAEGQSADRALLLAERFSGTAAFAHGLAFCQALESICGIEIPSRAQALRTVFAELERLRSHAAAITSICNSTALAVATSQAALIEEELLRLSCQVTGHRYLFGLVAPDGVTCDLASQDCNHLHAEVTALAERLDALLEMLRYSSSFLDRLEEVGIVTEEKARTYGLVGPIARASGVVCDIRKLFPYAGYRRIDFAVPVEKEGDGYARLRILFAEAEQSAIIIRNTLSSLPDGSARTELVRPRAGAALAAVEAPFGAAFHWLRMDEYGKVVRYHVTPPSFTNWHGFHLAAENFAFQDFPIILASFGLSNAECDR